MKSIYIQDHLHSSLKLIASLEKKALSELVEESLSKVLKKKLSDLPADSIAKLAMQGKAFDFLTDEKEDLYDLKDGVEIK